MTVIGHSRDLNIVVTMTRTSSSVTSAPKVTRRLVLVLKPKLLLKV